MADDINGRPLDPTSRTTDMLIREVERLQATSKENLLNLEAKIGARLDGMDKAMTLFIEDLKEAPTDIEKAVDCLKDVIFEKFNVTDKTFHVMDERFRGVDKQFELNGVALGAALSAAKEAVGKQNESSAVAINKSETATTKQIDQMTTIVNGNTNALNEKVDELRNQQTGTALQVLNLIQSVSALTAAPRVLPAPPQGNHVANYVVGLGLAFVVIVAAAVMIFTRHP